MDWLVRKDCYFHNDSLMNSRLYIELMTIKLPPRPRMKSVVNIVMRLHSNQSKYLTWLNLLVNLTMLGATEYFLEVFHAIDKSSSFVIFWNIGRSIKVNWLAISSGRILSRSTEVPSTSDLDNPFAKDDSKRELLFDDDQDEDKLRLDASRLLIVLTQLDFVVIKEGLERSRWLYLGFDLRPLTSSLGRMSSSLESNLSNAQLGGVMACMAIEDNMILWLCNS